MNYEECQSQIVVYLNFYFISRGKDVDDKIKILQEKIARLEV